jgi:hypothetical protein
MSQQPQNGVVITMVAIIIEGHENAVIKTLILWFVELFINT